MQHFQNLCCTIILFLCSRHSQHKICMPQSYSVRNGLLCDTFLRHHSHRWTCTVCLQTTMVHIPTSFIRIPQDYLTYFDLPRHELYLRCMLHPVLTLPQGLSFDSWTIPVNWTFISHCKCSYPLVSIVCKFFLPRQRMTGMIHTASINLAPCGSGGGHTIVEGEEPSTKLCPSCETNDFFFRAG